MVRELCCNHDIVLLQEHWLMSHDLHKLNLLHPNFSSFGLSAMNSKAAEGILVGRPFGGVAILWNNKLSNIFNRVASDDQFGRYISAKLHIRGVFDIIITCVYFPCVKSKNEYIVEASPIIGHIENVLSAYNVAEHVIAGDFNFPFDFGNGGFDLFKSVVQDYDLHCCDSDTISISNIRYTYCHESLNQFSWLDHFVVTNKLRQFLNNIHIVDSGANLSDHLPISCTLSKIPIQMTPSNNNNTSHNIKQVYKEHWNKADLWSYYYNTGSLLQAIDVPVHVMQCKSGCFMPAHRVDLDNYYNNIVDALKRASRGCVPKIPIKCLKPYWGEELNRLKEKSIDMHKLWRTCGSPKSGIINTARLTAKIDYKQAIKQAAIVFDQSNADELNSRFAEKSTKAFWKSWSAKFNKSLVRPISINGASEPVLIANMFKNHFAKSYINSADNMLAHAEFNDLYNLTMLNDQIETSVIDIEYLEKCIHELKGGKASGQDGIVAEHILHSHPSIVVHLKLLFSMILSHAYVPEAFGIGIVIPIVKDKRGDLSSLDNYRPITLSPVISKLFEAVMLGLYSKFMKTDDLQFGFKKNVGCSNAIFVLRQVTEFFNNRGSNVFIASLDASKAFDRINHYKLYTTLIRRGVPVLFINMICNWYGKLSIMIRWDNHDSDNLAVKSGVRQGGILSPILFNMYVDCIISTLRQKRLGCHLNNIYLGCIMYADDLLLVSSSVIELQLMLNITGDIGSSIGLVFNCAKSNCLSIGRTKIGMLASLRINEALIQWVDSIKYLGVTVSSGKFFKTDLSATRRKFFASVNSILSKCKYTSELVMLQLMESHCLPILLYAIECTCMANNDLRILNSWWNSVYRRIFNYHKWESVKELICYLGRLDLIHLTNLRQLNFIKRMIHNAGDNTVVTSLINYFTHSPEYHATCNKFDSNVVWSVAKIKAMMFVSFRNCCIN
jgi:exonuclease III